VVYIIIYALQQSPKKETCNFRFQFIFCQVCVSNEGLKFQTGVYSLPIFYTFLENINSTYIPILKSTCVFYSAW